MSQDFLAAVGHSPFKALATFSLSPRAGYSLAGPQLLCFTSEVQTYC